MWSAGACRPAGRLAPLCFFAAHERPKLQQLACAGRFVISGLRKHLRSGGSRKDEDVTSGATSYYDISVQPPKWAADGSNVLTLAAGRLRFYKLAPTVVTDIDLAM